MSHRTGSWGAVPRQLWQLQKGSLSDGDCSEMDTTFEEVQIFLAALLFPL